ncbi:hypothetical protein [Facklamia sp. P12934]
MAGLNVKTPTNIVGCSCDKVSDEERLVIQREIAQAKVKFQKN